MLDKLPHMKKTSTLSLHTHETNDPEVWVPWGYACVRVDLPGSGKSPGKLDPFSPNEARAAYDAIEWAAAQPWSDGKVGMTGISYLAVSQWRVASEQPPHLTCICPWEGVSDFYRDWNRHGGIMSTFYPGWFPMQPLMLQNGNGESPWFDLDDDNAPIGGPEALSPEQLKANRVDASAEIRSRELDEQWWRDRSSDLSKVTVPFLSAGNWGGLGLHLRGNVEPFIQSPAKEKWLEIHGGNHRDRFYLPEGEQLQKQFFDYYLRGEDNGWAERPRAHAVDEALPRCRGGLPRRRAGRERERCLVPGARRRRPLHDRAVRRADRDHRAYRGEAARLVVDRRHGPVRDAARIRARRHRGDIPRLVRSRRSGVAGLAARLASQARSCAQHRVAAGAHARRAPEAHPR
jgi:predicted acyl esterase